MIRKLPMIRMLTVMVAAFAVTAAAEASVIKGEVKAGDTGMPLTGANVVLEGTNRGAATDLDGMYVIFNVQPGTWTMRITMLGYEPKVIEGVVVGEDEKVTHNVTLTSSAVQLEEVTVTASASAGTQEQELKDRLNTSEITDAVSKEVLKKLPDPDVANVVRRATGVAVDKGDPIIRGLGARYSKVTLNKAAVSGTEPNRSAVSLELFPSSLMSQVTITKSYMPDMNGEFGGGSVNMNTFELTRDLEISASVTASYNSETTFKDFKGYRGGDTDWLGFDDGTRAMPEAVEAADRKIRLGNYTPGEIQDFGSAFPNTWSASTTGAAMPNTSYSVSLGNRTELLGRPFSFMVTGLYSNSRETRSVDRNVYQNGAEPGTVQPWHDYSWSTYTTSIGLGSMVAAKYAVSDLSNLTWNFLYSRDTKDETRLMSGYNDDRQTDIRTTRLRFLSETTATSQLTGNHAIPAASSTFDWQFTYSRGVRYEPDTRSTQYENNGEGTWVFADETYSGSRIFNRMLDNTYSGGGDWTMRPLGESSDFELKTGAYAMYRDRDSDYHRYEFEEAANSSFDSDFLSQDPEDLFAPGNINPYGWQVTEYTRPNDSYTAQHNLYAGYVMMEVPVSVRMFLSGGVRYEDSRQQVKGYEPFKPVDTAALSSSELHTGDWLPALNMRYMIQPRMNLRLAASQTVSRPDFREMAEFEYTDFVGGRAVIGNPDLNRALIRNYDVRWEMVHGVADLVAVSVFYKDFENPIETVIQNTAQNRVSYDNAMGATNYGVEFEVRQNLGLFSETLQTLTLTSNLSLIESEVELDQDALTIQTSSQRPLAGQSPYLLNLGLGYMHPTMGTQVNLFYNTFGERISEVGANGLPDVYERPFHDLDLTARQPLGRNLALKLAVKNMLNSEVRFEQGGAPTTAYHRGRTISIGFSYSN